jgi:hypothetical protein
VLCATLLTAHAAAAQTPDPLGKWFSDRGISIRKVFDGSKEEQNPASIFFVREPTGKDREFASTDVAAKVSEIEWNPGTSASVILYPVIDYHRSTNAAKLINKAGGSARLELRPVGLTAPTPPDANAPLPTLKGHYWPIAPTVIVDAKLARDWASKTTESRYGVQLFPTSNIRGLPGSDFRSGSGAFLGRYYPYVGVEHHRFGGSGHDTTLTVSFVRLWVEMWPITTPTMQFLQLTFDLTSRHRVGGESTMPSQLSDAALGANLYLDGNGHVGVGIEYANGRDAAQRFARRERTTIGLKVKF